MNTRFVEMDARAVAYVRSELEATNKVGQLIAATLNLDEGQVLAAVPDSYLSDTYNFREGIFQRVGLDRTNAPGGYVEEVPSTEADVAARVCRAMSLDRRRALICESYLLRAKDLAQASYLPIHTAVCGEFVYHWVTHGDAHEDILTVVRLAYSRPLGFAVLSALPVTPAEMLARSELDANILSTIATTAECVLVGAYDGESVLIWLRKGSLLSIKD